MTLTDTAEVFAKGYALATAAHHPIGLTERARRTLREAERVVEAVPDPSGVPRLLLGQLEGIWAVIYRRREKIEKLHAGAFKKILTAISGLDWKSIVYTVETQQLIDPSVTGAMLAGELRSRISSMIAGDLPADDRAAWNTVITEALVDGTVEGQVAALAILGQTSGVSIDWELAGVEAKAALGTGQALGAEADLWIQRQVGGMSYELSQKLASIWDAGGSKQQMLDAITGTLGSDTNMANLLLESAISKSLSQGSLDTYATAGVPYADFVTAGDTRVCAECSGYEDNNPYRLELCPQPGIHLRCRCTVSPSDFFPSLSLVSSTEA